MDSTYYFIFLGVFLFVLVFSIYAQAKVSKAYKGMSQVETEKKETGAAVARNLLDGNPDTRAVKIVAIKGELTDNYNPSKKILSLSAGVHNKATVAAVAIAAHEVGHAYQHAEGSALMKLRSFFAGLSKFSSLLLIPLLIVGIVLSVLYSASIIGVVVIGIAVGFYLIAFLFSLVTWPLERNASNRALEMLVISGSISEVEVRGAKSVLRAAELTYIAALMVSLMYLLRFVLIILSSRK